MSRVWETQLIQNHLTKIWATRDKLNAASIKNNQESLKFSLRAAISLKVQSFTASSRLQWRTKTLTVTRLFLILQVFLLRNVARLQRSKVTSHTHCMFSWDSLKLKPCDRDTTHSLSAKIGDSVHLQKGQESRGNRKLVTRSSLMVEGRCCCDSADWRQVCTADNLQSIKLNCDKPINKYSYGLFVFKQELSVSSKTADMQEIFITWRILFSFNKYWMNKHVFISLSVKIIRLLVKHVCI